MKSRKKSLAAAGLATALLAVAPNAASAAVTAKVSGDDGAPAALTPGTPLAIRNMDARVFAHVDATDAASWTFSVTDPSGVAATTIAPSCWNTLLDDDSRVAFRGNGTYTVTVSLFSQDNCVAPKATQTYTYTVGASIAVGALAGPVLTRPVNVTSPNVHLLDFSGNPGATLYEINYAKGGVIGPDGAISGPSERAFLDSATGKIRLTLSSPGSYVVVARAKSGDYYTAWSTPVTVKAIAPFDLSFTTFPDTRGPRYQVRGVLREASAAGGRVTVAIAKGANGKRFRTLGRAKINSQGVFKLRFTVRKRGKYRLRYSFRGSEMVARGTASEAIRVRRILG